MLKYHSTNIQLNWCHIVCCFTWRHTVAQYSLSLFSFIISFPGPTPRSACVKKCAWQPLSVSVFEHPCELVRAKGFWSQWGGWGPLFCCVCCWPAKPWRPGSSVTPRLRQKSQNPPEMIPLRHSHPKGQPGRRAPPHPCAWSPQRSGTPSSTWTPSSPAWSLWWASLATRRCSGSYTGTSAWGTDPMSWLAAWLWEICFILSLPSPSMCLR